MHINKINQEAYTCNISILDVNQEIKEREQ